MALFSHEDKQAIYGLSDMATKQREDFFKIFGLIVNIIWVLKFNPKRIFGVINFNKI